MIEPQDCDDGDEHETLPLPTLPPMPRERVSLQKSSICSRSYFMVVMVFFHVYIINVIVLLLYVHYNNGPGDVLATPNRDEASRGSNHHKPPESHQQQSDSAFHRDMREVIVTVGHVQKVSLVPDKVHEMRTLSLKPLLFGQEELTEQLNLSPEEIFNLLDLNQDGQLQLQEILTHSRVRDGIWLTPEDLREIYAGLKADPDGNGLLSLEEFRSLGSDAFQRFLQQRGVKSSQLVRNSRHTWLYQGKGAHQVLRDLKKRVTRLTRLPSTLVDLSEPLQVVRYEQGGHYHAHHDSGPVYPETACTHTRLAANTSTPFETSCRYITVLFYLNSVEGGGETAFPVADNRTYEEVVRYLLCVAVCWVGEQDEYSLHGGCVVTRGTKWVANNWINIDPDYQRQARYQQLVSQQGEEDAEDEGEQSQTSPEQLHTADSHQEL
ncbi:unnamed protein product [Coregonus sp. 'balchen']|nr:unnamed protein product [Coregonus sp. 'balchen']